MKHDIKELIDKGIEESNEYIEIYKIKYNYYENLLNKLENNFNISDFEKQRNNIVDEMEKYKIKIKEEEELIEKIKESNACN